MLELQVKHIMINWATGYTWTGTQEHCQLASQLVDQKILSFNRYDSFTHCTRDLPYSILSMS